MSPVSVEGGEIKIQTGSQSLESTLSDGKDQLKQIIHEANVQTEDKTAVVEALTDDIFRGLMTEMKLDLDLLLINSPKSISQDRQSKSINLINFSYYRSIIELVPE